MTEHKAKPTGAASPGRRSAAGGAQHDRPHVRYSEPGALIPAALACMAGIWHTPPREEDDAMNERQKEAWSGVLLTVLLVGLLLGGLLVLRLMGN